METKENQIIRGLYIPKGASYKMKWTTYFVELTEDTCPIALVNKEPLSDSSGTTNLIKLLLTMF